MYAGNVPLSRLLASELQPRGYSIEPDQGVKSRFRQVLGWTDCRAEGEGRERGLQEGKLSKLCNAIREREAIKAQISAGKRSLVDALMYRSIVEKRRKV